ncbi:MAG: magnesium transporter, partial [Myxococcales bacterium]|nr:magnesium transporter [Myxococcales bacterium]
MQNDLDILRRAVDGAQEARDAERLASILGDAHEADIAAILGDLENAEKRWTVFSAIRDDAQAARTLIECREDVADEILTRLPPDRLTVLLEEMHPDDRADILGLMDRTAAAVQLAELPAEERGEANELLRYPDESAGGLMTPDFFWVRTGATANEAIERLRAAKDVEEIAYIYVLDDAMRLQGVASIRDLLTHPAHSTVGSFMTTAIHSVSPDTDQEEVARRVARYNLVALPVVAADGRMLGVITVDDVIDV